MTPVDMRVIEELDNGDQVITYFQVEEVDNRYYYVYNGVNHGPFDEFQEAVDAATFDLVECASVSG